MALVRHQQPLLRPARTHQSYWPLVSLSLSCVCIEESECKPARAGEADTAGLQLPPACRKLIREERGRAQLSVNVLVTYFCNAWCAWRASVASKTRNKNESEWPLMYVAPLNCLLQMFP